MAEIEVIFYDGPIVETEDAIELPPPAEFCDDIPTLSEACSLVLTMVHERMTPSAAVSLDGLFFVGASMVNDTLRIIHTPAADAFFDEHYPGWRHGLALPISLN